MSGNNSDMFSSTGKSSGGFASEQKTIFNFTVNDALKFLRVNSAGNNLEWAAVAAGGGDWTLNGNTVGALKTLGTIDNFDLPFITQNQERMRIDAVRGHIGIATAPLTNYVVSVKSTITGGAVFANFYSSDAIVGTQNPSTSFYSVRGTPPTFVGDFVSSFKSVIDSSIGGSQLGLDVEINSSGVNIVYGTKHILVGGGANMYGTNSDVQSYGTGVAYGTKLRSYSQTGNTYGAYIEAISDNSIGNPIGVHILAQGQESIGINLIADNTAGDFCYGIKMVVDSGNIGGWGIHQTGGATWNYFEASVGVGIDQPLAKLHVVGDVRTNEGLMSAVENWRFGTVKVGAVTVDLANHVEVEIGGVLYKLIKAV